MKKRFAIVYILAAVLMGVLLTGCGKGREISMQAVANANKVSAIREYYGTVKITNDGSLNDFVTTEYVDGNAVYHLEDDYFESIRQGSSFYCHDKVADEYYGVVEFGEVYEDEVFATEYQICHPEMTPLEEIIEKKVTKNEILLTTKYTHTEPEEDGCVYEISTYTLDKNTLINKGGATTRYNAQDEVIEVVKVTVEKVDDMPASYYEMQNRLNTGGETRDVTFMNKADGIGYGVRVRKGEPVSLYLYEDFKLYNDEACTDEKTESGDFNESATFYVVIEE